MAIAVIGVTLAGCGGGQFDWSVAAPSPPTEETREHLHKPTR
jgi:hypothetical protein